MRRIHRYINCCNFKPTSLIRTQGSRGMGLRGHSIPDRSQSTRKSQSIDNRPLAPPSQCASINLAAALISLAVGSRGHGGLGPRSAPGSAWSGSGARGGGNLSRHRFSHHAAVRVRAAGDHALSSHACKPHACPSQGLPRRPGRDHPGRRRQEGHASG